MLVVVGPVDAWQRRPVGRERHLRRIRRRAWPVLEPYVVGGAQHVAIQRALANDDAELLDGGVHLEFGAVCLTERRDPLRLAEHEHRHVEQLVEARGMKRTTRRQRDLALHEAAPCHPGLDLCVGPGLASDDGEDADLREGASHRSPRFLQRGFHVPVGGLELAVRDDDRHSQRPPGIAEQARGLQRADGGANIRTAP